MRTGIRLFWCLASLLLHGSLWAQTTSGPDDRYKIEVIINGKALTGSQQLSLLLQRKSPAEQDAIQQNAVFPVRRNDVLQIVVNVTDPRGTKKTMTGSNLISYEHFGCLTVGTGGLMTVTPSGVCPGPDSPLLWVVLLSPNKQPITYNEFLLKVVP